MELIDFLWGINHICNLPVSKRKEENIIHGILIVPPRDSNILSLTPCIINTDIYYITFPFQPKKKYNKREVYKTHKNYFVESDNKLLTNHKIKILAFIDQAIQFIAENKARPVPPIAKTIKGYKFHEIRVKDGSSLIRIFYFCYHQEKLVLLNISSWFMPDSINGFNASYGLIKSPVSII